MTPVVLRAPVPLGDVDATFADIARARDELGWKPRVPLGEGLRTVVEWVTALSLTGLLRPRARDGRRAAFCPSRDATVRPNN